MAGDFFSDVQGRIPFAGSGSSDPLAFTVYDPDRLVLGTPMADHLRVGVCLWHSFAWDGRDMFGLGTLDRPWLAADADPMAAARQRMAAAFEFIEKLGVPYYCFHDRDVAPDGGRPTCSATRATRPAPRRTPTRRSSRTPPPRSG